jgi:creatinine amidohydrolase
MANRGVIGDATTATKEKGDRILESVANGWVQVIQDIYAYRQPKVGEG